MQKTEQQPSPLQARIRSCNEILLAGHVLEMSLIENRTRELWAGFGPVRRKIMGASPTELYSVEVYPGLEYFQSFNPQRSFRKWACVRIEDSAGLPKGVQTLLLPAGMYAVFLYRGSPEEVSGFYQQIFTEWLAQSKYQLDDRPHFAVMGENYRPGDPQSEEEIWIPVMEPGTSRTTANRK